jgi:hypothetical protein
MKVFGDFFDVESFIHGLSVGFPAPKFGIIRRHKRRISFHNFCELKKLIKTNAVAFVLVDQRIKFRDFFYVGFLLLIKNF